MRPGEPVLGQIPGIPPLSARGSDPPKLHVRGQRPGAGHERLSAMQTWEPLAPARGFGRKGRGH